MAGTDAAATFRGPTEPMLLEWTMAHLLDNQSSLFGHRLAIQSLHQGVGRTYSEVRDRTRMLVASLIDHGFRPGDRAILFMGNCIEFIELFFAVASMGGVAVVLGPTFSIEETQEAIKLVEPKMIFVAQRVGFRSNQDFIRGTATSFRGEVVIIPTTTPQSPDACVSFEAFSAHAKFNASSNELESIERFWGTSPPSEACCFQFTSGTTGSRKASMLSHKNLINNANIVGHRLKLNAADKICCCPPLSHCFGLVCGLLASFLHGSTLVIPSEVFEPRACLSALSTETCSIVHGVPSMFEALVRQQKRRQNSSQSTLRLRSGLIAGSTPSRSLLGDIKDHLGLENLLYPFGMTELSAVCICTSMSDSLLADNSSVGTAMPHTEIKIIDETGKTLEAGKSGELCVSGYLVHLGYYQNEVKTKEAWHIDDIGKRWLRTGDLAVLNSDGKCIIVGRSKDIIKKHGENIAPKEIEELLAAESFVKSVAVVGVPHEKYGESIVAFVELHSRSALEDQSLKAWLRGQNLSPHKMPDIFLPVGDVPGALPFMPMNPSGKVLKTELRAFAIKLMAEN